MFRKSRKNVHYFWEEIFLMLSFILLGITVTILTFIILGSCLSGCLKNYSTILLDTPEYWVYFWNSVKLSVLILIGTVVVDLLAAYILYRLRFKGRNILVGLLFLFMLLPYQVLMTPQLLVIYKLNLLNRSEGVILPNIFGTLGVILLLQYMNRIPKETIEAAKMDGAGEGIILKKVVFPQIREGLATLILLCLVDTWNLVEQPANILTESTKQPLSIAFAGMEGYSIGSICAGSVIFLFPVAIIFLKTKDYLLEGLSSLVVKRR